MRSIRTATIHDAALLRTMIRELAEFEHELDVVTITEEDLRRDGFGQNPRFGALIADWDAQPAGYAFFFYYYSTWAGRVCFLRICLSATGFEGAGSGRRCWLRWRELRLKENATEYIGKCLTGIRERSSCTRRWEPSFAIDGVRSC